MRVELVDHTDVNGCGGDDGDSAHDAGLCLVMMWFVIMIESWMKSGRLK